MRKLLILPLFLVAACGGDGTGATGTDQLTAEQAAQLNRAMFGLVSGLAGSGVPDGASLNLSAGPLSQENTFTSPIHERVPCTPSGNIDLDGEITIGFDDVSSLLTMTADISAEPRSCAYRMENGDVIKISGDPDLDIEMTIAGVPGEPLSTMQVRETGAFKWTQGESSGRCAVDLTSSLAAATQMVTVTGTFCGFPVSETFPAEIEQG